MQSIMKSSITSKPNSSSVMLDTVDDYLAPSQACINPLFQPPPSSTETAKANDAAAAADGGKAPAAAETPIVVPRRKRRIARSRISASVSATANGSHDSIVPKRKAAEKKVEDPIKASIADCLACSGCVTTAETVLLEQQHSLTKLREIIDKKDPQQRGRVLTISPASWADILRVWDEHTASGNNDRPTSTATTIPADDKQSNKQQRQRQRKFATLLHRVLNVDLVVDGSVPLQWTHQQSAMEFCESYRSNNNNVKNNTNATTQTTPPPSIAVHSDQTIVYDNNSNKTPTTMTASEYQARYPTTKAKISSTCPAVICLIEKNVSHHVPHIATTKSPMSMFGSSLRAEYWSIMPCHDKKLEASRKDFLNNINKKQDVDLVLTTNECMTVLKEWVMIHSNCVNKMEYSQLFHYLDASLDDDDVLVSVLKEDELDRWIRMESMEERFRQPMLLTRNIDANAMDVDEVDESSQSSIGTIDPYASGGHADYIFRYACQELFGYTIPSSVPIWTHGNATAISSSSDTATATATTTTIRSARLANRRKRSQDYYIATLMQDTTTGKYYLNGSDNNTKNNIVVVLKFAIANGMQTLQRVLNNNNDNKLDFIEAMACPSGCINGGGQIRSSDTIGRENPTQTRQRIVMTRKVLHENRVPTTTKHDVALPRALQENPKSTRTQYHVVPPMQYAMGAAAGVAVEDMVW